MTIEQQYLRDRAAHAPTSARTMPLTHFCIQVLAELDIAPVEHLASINGHVVRVLTEGTTNEV